MSKLTDLLLADAYIGGGSGGGGGGETWTETLLWENETPTVEFSATILSVNNVDADYIKFRWKMNTNVNDNRYRVYICDLRLYDRTIPSAQSGIGFANGPYCRNINLNFGEGGYLTKIKIQDSKQIGASTTNNAYNIPIAIYGIKKG